MKTIIAASVILIAGLAYAAIDATDFKPLEAKYLLRGTSIIDPPEDEKIDRVALWMTGDGAKNVYEAMPAKPRLICGTQWKQAGGLSCTKTGQDYACAVAIVLSSGETAGGMVC